MTDRSVEFGYVVSMGAGYALSFSRGQVDLTPDMEQAMRLTNMGAKQLAGQLKLRYKAPAKGVLYAPTPTD
jgi:hypothetical protein